MLPACTFAATHLLEVGDAQLVLERRNTAAEGSVDLVADRSHAKAVLELS